MSTNALMEDNGAKPTATSLPFCATTTTATTTTTTTTTASPRKTRGSMSEFVDSQFASFDRVYGISKPSMSTGSKQVGQDGDTTMTATLTRTRSTTSMDDLHSVEEEWNNDAEHDDDEHGNSQCHHSTFWDLIVSWYLPSILLGTAHLLRSLLFGQFLTFAFHYIPIPSWMTNNSRYSSKNSNYNSKDRDKDGEESSPSWWDSLFVHYPRIRAVLGHTGEINNNKSDTWPPPAFTALAILTLLAFVVHPDGLTWIMLGKIRDAILSLFQTSATMMRDYGIVPTIIAATTLASLGVLGKILYGILTPQTSLRHNNGSSNNSGNNHGTNQSSFAATTKKKKRKGHHHARASRGRIKGHLRTVPTATNSKSIPERAVYEDGHDDSEEQQITNTTNTNEDEIATSQTWASSSSDTNNTTILPPARSRILSTSSTADTDDQSCGSTSIRSIASAPTVTTITTSTTAATSVSSLGGTSVKRTRNNVNSNTAQRTETNRGNKDKRTTASSTLAGNRLTGANHQNRKRQGKYNLNTNNNNKSTRSVGDTETTSPHSTKHHNSRAVSRYPPTSPTLSTSSAPLAHRTHEFKRHGDGNIGNDGHQPVHRKGSNTEINNIVTPPPTSPRNTSPGFLSSSQFLVDPILSSLSSSSNHGRSVDNNYSQSGVAAISSSSPYLYSDGRTGQSPIGSSRTAARTNFSHHPNDQNSRTNTLTTSHSPKREIPSPVIGQWTASGKLPLKQHSSSTRLSPSSVQYNVPNYAGYYSCDARYTPGKMELAAFLAQVGLVGTACANMLNDIADMDELHALTESQYRSYNIMPAKQAQIVLLLDARHQKKVDQRMAALVTAPSTQNNSTRGSYHALENSNNSRIRPPPGLMGLPFVDSSENKSFMVNQSSNTPVKSTVSQSGCLPLPSRMNWEPENATSFATPSELFTGFASSEFSGGVSKTSTLFGTPLETGFDYSQEVVNEENGDSSQIEADLQKLGGQMVGSILDF